jgi:hypothetical protein
MCQSSYGQHEEHSFNNQQNGGRSFNTQDGPHDRSGYGHQGGGGFGPNGRGSGQNGRGSGQKGRGFGHSNHNGGSQSMTNGNMPNHHQQNQPGNKKVSRVTGGMVGNIGNIGVISINPIEIRSLFVLCFPILLQNKIMVGPKNFGRVWKTRNAPFLS